MRELGLPYSRHPGVLREEGGLKPNKMSSPSSAKSGQLRCRRAVLDFPCYQMEFCHKVTSFLDLWSGYHWGKSPPIHLPIGNCLVLAPPSPRDEFPWFYIVLHVFTWFYMNFKENQWILKEIHRKSLDFKGNPKKINGF